MDVFCLEVTTVFLPINSVSVVIGNFETKTDYAPVEAFYKILSGSDSIVKLVMAYNRITEGRKIFSVENDMVIIKGNINHWIDLKEIGTLDENDVVSSSVDGGEEKLKELVDELNRHIVEYNEKLFDRAFAICKK